MGDNSNILATVRFARQRAAAGDYDEAIQAYARAKNDIQCMILGHVDEERWLQVSALVATEESAVSHTKHAYDLAASALQPTPPVQPSPPAPHQRAAEPAAKPAAVDPAPPANAPKPANPPKPAANPGRPGNPPKPAKPVNPVNPRRMGPPPAGGKAKSVPQDPLGRRIIEEGILCRAPGVTWDNVAGLGEVKQFLLDNLIKRMMRPDIFKGIMAPWRSVLFFGPPGTGKTFIAKAIATECKRTFFNVGPSTVTLKWVGESEQLVRRLFQLAEEMGPSTIFFDEFDALASHRDQGGSGGGEVSKRVKSELLTCLDGAGSGDASSLFIIAATNFPWDIDNPALRRFQKRIYIPLPDAEGREAIIRANLASYVDDAFDFTTWARELDGYSCSDITNLCKDAVGRSVDHILADIPTAVLGVIRASQFMARTQVTNQDFEAVKQKRKPAVSTDILQRYLQWDAARGAD
jgi:katanin p60 ATPase-containing subunit A1